MIKVNAMGVIAIVFEKELVGKDIDSIFNNDTYFYTGILIDEIEVKLRMSNGETKILNVIDWEVKECEIDEDED